jgi:hypothetical protein
MTVKASVYFHISNGGVTLAVEDNGNGPCLVMKAAFFGQGVRRVAVMTDRAGLEAARAMLDKAMGEQYSPTFTMAGRAPGAKGLEVSKEEQDRRGDEGLMLRSGSHCADDQRIVKWTRDE